jgi:glutaredoxin
MKALIWTRDNCTYCVQAKNLMNQHGIEYQEFKIGEGYTKEDLLEVVPHAKTLPQIFLDGEYVGGFQELKTRLN